MDGKTLIKTHEHESAYFYPEPHRSEIIAIIDAALAQARQDEREACVAEGDAILDGFPRHVLTYEQRHYLEGVQAVLSAIRARRP